MSGFLWKSILAVAIFSSRSAPSLPDAKEDVEQALFKLAASENYSWVATTMEEAEGKPPQVAETFEGKSVKNGWCRVSKPKTKKSSEAILKGDRIALMTPEGWKAVDVKGAAPGAGKPDKDVRHAQEFVQAKAPIAEAKVLLGRVQDLRLQDNGLYSTTLAEKDVPLILERVAASGKKIPSFDEPRLRVNFRINGGFLASYELVVTGRRIKGKKNPVVEEGLISFAVDFSDVGTTTLEVPDEARRLLE